MASKPMTWELYAWICSLTSDRNYLRAQTREFEDHIEDREAPTIFTWVNQNAINYQISTLFPFAKSENKNDVKQVGSDPSNHP